MSCDIIPIVLLPYSRYKACWLPLLDKHTKGVVVDGPLVVPLDCEWIWHCHRLNPVHTLPTMIICNSRTLRCVTNDLNAESDSQLHGFY
jgi:hypothetical protein